MASKTRQEEYNTPNVPATLVVDAHPSYYNDHNSPLSPNTSATTPYLGWKARLSQIWINRWTVLIVLVLIRVLLMLGDLNDDIGSAKEKALSACTKVEDVGSAMASMPHYLSLGVNDLAASGITNAVGGLVSTLELLLTGVQEIILFIINLVVGTYVCLISALIHGGLEAAMSAIEGTTELLNEAISGIANGIEDEVQDFQELLSKFTDKINDLTGGVGGVIDSIFGDDTVDIPEIPDLDLSDDIGKLKNVDIDTSKLVNGLDKLNDTIPDFQDVKEATRKAVSLPFNLVKEQIDETWGSYNFSRDVFPLAQKQALTFCSDNSKLNEFFESLFVLAANAKKGFIAGLLIAAVLAMVVMYPIERRKWTLQKQLSVLVSRAGHNPLDVVYITSRPYSARAGIWLGDKMATGRRSLLVRWAWAYATTLPAIFLLSLALAGYFSSLCQYFVLMGVERKVPELVEQVGDFAGDVVNSLQGASVQWATDANAVITDFSDDINKDIFSYVTDATGAVNDTLNTFVDTMNEGLDTVFEGTILHKPITDVVFCLVTVKVEGIQKGLTWVHDNAHVSFPLFDNNTFALGAAESIDGDSELKSFLASPSSTTTDEITGAAQQIADHLRRSIVTELLISTGILLTYVIVVLAGVVVAAMRVVGANNGQNGMGFVTTSDEVHRTRVDSPSKESQFAQRSSGDPFGDDKAVGVRGGYAAEPEGHGHGHGQMTGNKF